MAEPDFRATVEYYVYVGEGGYRAWITNSIHPGQASSCGFVTPWNHHWLYGVHHLDGS